jgi:hypothetical protein
MDAYALGGVGIPRFESQLAGWAPGMNRVLRRMQRFGKSFSARRSHGEMANTEAEIFSAKTPPDVTSVRAKSADHGKRTADKWNQ